MAVNKDKFNSIVNVVIDKLEGGYYHPDMLNDGRVKDSRYSNSGETMFGIDRKAGGKINDTASGRAFWSIIDNANARKGWKWNYKGGELAPQLKQYVTGIIYPQYDGLASKYLSPKTKDIVDNDNRLLFHFIYGTWNGAGWFKKFANDMNKAVDSGITNSDELTKVAIASRTQEGLKSGSSPNSLIAQGGNKIEGFIDSLKNSVSSGYTQTEKSISSGYTQTQTLIKKNPITTVILVAITIISGYMIYKYTKKNK